MPGFVRKSRLKRRIPLPDIELLKERGQVSVVLQSETPLRIVRGSVFQKTFQPGIPEAVPEEVWRRWLVSMGCFKLVGGNV